MLSSGHVVDLIFIILVLEWLIFPS